MRTQTNKMVKCYICDLLLYIMPIDGNVEAVAKVLELLAPVIRAFVARGDDSDEAVEQFRAEANATVKPFMFDPAIHAQQ